MILSIIVLTTLCDFCYAGIPPHIDTHSAFEDEILSLSLGAEVNLLFFIYIGCLNDTKAKFLAFNKRSYVLHGIFSLYSWMLAC